MTPPIGQRKWIRLWIAGVVVLALTLSAGCGEGRPPAVGERPQLTVEPVATGSAAGAAVAVTFMADGVAVGQTVKAEVTLLDVTALFGAEFHLTFDAERLEVVDAEEGSEGIQIADGGFLEVGFVAQNDVDNEAGTIDYAVTQVAPSAGVSGSGTLAVIEMRGRAPGEATITLRQVLLANTEGESIPNTITQATDRLIVE